MANVFGMTPNEIYMAEEDEIPLNLFQKISKRTSGQVPQPAPEQAKPVVVSQVPDTAPPTQRDINELSLKPDYSGLFQETPEEKEYKRKVQEQLEMDRNALTGGVSDLQRQHDEFGANQERDMGGLVAALDYFGKSNNLAGYKRPASPEEIATKKAAISKMLQEAKQGIADVDLKKLQMSADGKSQQRMAEIMLRQQRSEQGKGAEFVKMYQSDPDVKAIREGYRGVGELKTLLNSESKTGYQGIGTKLAKAMGASPISNFDVKNLSGPPDLISQYQRTWNKAAEGTLTPGDMADFNKLMSAMDDYYKSNLDYHNRRYVEEIGPGIFGVSPELGKRVVVSGAATPPAKKSPQERFAELDERAKKKD